MKYLVLITFVLYTGIAGAQRLSKKKVDAKTGDTIQTTKEKMLYNPMLKNLVLGESYKVGWRIEKLMAKNHHADTLLFFLHIYGGGFISNKDYSPLIISFTDGHSLSLPLRFAFTNQYFGVNLRYGDNSDTYATYVLQPDAVHDITTRQMSAIKVTTMGGLVGYAVKAKRAIQIQKYLDTVAKVE